MRLIDADELKKDDEVTQWLSLDAVRTGKMLKMFSELFVKKIDDAPTVQAVPIEELQEIRQEIEQIECQGQVDTHTSFIRTNEQVKNMTLEIIDKHIKEIEE